MQICGNCGTFNNSQEKRCEKCDRSLRDAIQTLDANVIVGDYRVVRYIGHGGYGVVYEGIQESTNLRVAIKETFNSDHIDYFRREFALLRNLHHENLPRYYDVFMEDGFGYLVMEFIEGDSLDKVLALQNKPMRVSRVMDFMAQLCDAVHYLHSQKPPLTHRDIKPANIILSSDQTIKLVDFGLSKGERRESETRTHLLHRGFSPIYAPYEQAILDGRVTTRSDIYNIGATLYHLLTNKQPLGSQERELTGKDPLLSPRSLNSAISPALNTVILKAMARRPEERYATVQELQTALETATPIVSRTPQSVSAFVIWGGLLLVVLLLGAIVWGILSAQDGTAQAVAPASPSATVTLTPTITATATHNPPTFTLTPTRPVPSITPTNETDGFVLPTPTRTRFATSTPLDDADTPTVTPSSTSTVNPTRTPTRPAPTIQPTIAPPSATPILVPPTLVPTVAPTAVPTTPPAPTSEPDEPDEDPTPEPQPTNEPPPPPTNEPPPPPPPS